MILDGSKRKQELIERPDALLKANEAFKMDQATKADDLKTSAANRLLAEKDIGIRDRAVTVAEKNAETTAAELELGKSAEARLSKKADREATSQAAQDKRDAEIHPLKVKTAKYEVDTAEYNMESAKMKIRKERVIASEGAPQENVDLAIRLNDMGLAGDPEAMKQRDIILNSIATDPNLKGLLGYNVPYGDMATLTPEMLNNPNDPGGVQTEKMIQLMFNRMKLNMAAHKQNEKEKLARVAAGVLATAQAEATGEAKGDILGTAEGYTEASNRGLELPPEEISEGQQSKIQETMGNFLSEGPLKDAGANAGKLWFDKNLDKKGEFAKAVKAMPAAMYNDEIPKFQNFLSTILSDEYADKTNKEFREELYTLAKSDIFAKESPIRLKLLDIWYKKTKIDNLRDIKSFQQNTTTPTPKV